VERSIEATQRVRASVELVARALTTGAELHLPGTYQPPLGPVGAAWDTLGTTSRSGRWPRFPPAWPAASTAKQTPVARSSVSRPRPTLKICGASRPRPSRSWVTCAVTTRRFGPVPGLRTLMVFGTKVLCDSDRRLWFAVSRLATISVMDTQTPSSRRQPHTGARHSQARYLSRCCCPHQYKSRLDCPTCKPLLRRSENA
jgi:hypothetical protein